MSRIRIDALHENWMKSSEYRREYKALEEEFSLVAALIAARTRAGLEQQNAAELMRSAIRAALEEA